MTNFVLTVAAKSDLKAIGRYTQENWGIKQRNRYLILLNESFQKLAANPELGRDCSELREGYRKLSVGKHVIFCRRIADDTIEIVRVLHERMDVENHLIKPD